MGSCIFVVLLGTGMSCAYAIRKKKRLAAMKRQHFKQHGGFLLFEEMNVGALPDTDRGENAEKQSTAKGVDGEVSPPAMLRPGIGAEPTHLLTLVLNKPLDSRIH